MTPASSRGIAFVGDVHLHRDDPALDAFARFLAGLAERADRLVLAGDLFDLWLGERELELPHQTVVLDALRALRRGGMVVRYLEGNRDFHVGEAYAGDALDEATDAGVSETLGGTRVFAVHGDLANVADRQYRAWRRVARSRAAWALFRLLPLRRRLRVAEGTERRMRGSNLAFKREFPDSAVREYAARQLARGHDAVVLGHFHVERDLVAAPPSPPGRIVVLPEWKGSRRHLRLGPDGVLRFESSAP